jgi:hypothetical protein
VVAVGGEVVVHAEAIVGAVVVVVHGVVVVVVELVEVDVVEVEVEVVEVEVEVVEPVDVVGVVDVVEVVAVVELVVRGGVVGVPVGGAAACSWPAPPPVPSAAAGWAGAVCRSADPPAAAAWGPSVAAVWEPSVAGGGCCQYTARLLVRSSCPPTVTVALRSRRVTSPVGRLAAGVAGLVPPRLSSTASADRVATPPTADATAEVLAT